ncbi:MAG: DUF1847 domain-containing protein [Deltaproteobacteria bacterium]|nr:DUF1847 domain-containing protein [Candidatus Anaeroferrophillacea bacterium]
MTTPREGERHPNEPQQEEKNGAKSKLPRCARCTVHRCREGIDCFGVSDETLPAYDETDRKLHRAATAIEGRHYCKEPRLRELILFAREMEVKTIGIAFCIGLAEEAGTIDAILRQEFEVASICCKCGAVDKRLLELEQIDPARTEYMCNPAIQAAMLNRAGTELNVICGLCVGHDAIFTRHSAAPVTTLIAKDRVLAHNPAGALYCQYIRRTFT